MIPVQAGFLLTLLGSVKFASHHFPLAIGFAKLEFIISLADFPRRCSLTAFLRVEFCPHQTLACARSLPRHQFTATTTLSLASFVPP